MLHFHMESQPRSSLRQCVQSRSRNCCFTQTCPQLKWSQIFPAEVSVSPPCDGLPKKSVAMLMSFIQFPRPVLGHVLFLTSRYPLRPFASSLFRCVGIRLRYHLRASSKLCNLRKGTCAMLHTKKHFL